MIQNLLTCNSLSKYSKYYNTDYISPKEEPIDANYFSK